MSTVYGYICVSTKEQIEDRQLFSMQELNIPEKNLFIDKQSGKSFNRPAYKRMVKRMKKDDLLYIKSIGRFSVNSYTSAYSALPRIAKDLCISINDYFLLAQLNNSDTIRKKPIIRKNNK